MERQFIEGSTKIHLHIYETITEIKISAADMIWEMFSFHFVNSMNQMIHTNSFRVLESNSIIKILIPRGTASCYRICRESNSWRLHFIHILWNRHA